MARTTRLRPAFGTLLLLGALCSEGWAADGVVWVYPPPNSLITESPVAVFGYLTGSPQVSIEAKVVSADGATAPQRVPLGDFKGKIFSGSIPLTPGRNNVLVAGAVLPLLYRPGLVASKEGDFQKPFPHGNKIESCECHTFHRGEISLKQSVPELCLSCHKLGTQAERAALQRNKHTLEVTRQCLRCHEPHAAFQPKLLRADDSLCSVCHPESQYAAYSHDRRPVPASCGTCHDAHASGYPKLLKAESQGLLCKKCHQEVWSPKKYPKSFHEPVENVRCADCHVSHPQGNPRLLKAAVPQLCRVCHKAGKEGGHAGKLEECGTCHEHHWSAQATLLSEGVTEVCLRCHPQRRPGATAHAALKGGCTRCHDPHDAKAKQDSQRVCGSCHEVRGSEFASAHGGFSMPATSQCVTCHDPHASTYPSLLKGTVHYPLKNGGCASCHDQKGNTLELRYQGSDNCLRCHGQITGTSVIKDVDKVHKPVSQIDCTACHNPHLGMRRALLLEEPETLCGWCHGIVIRDVAYLHGVFKQGGTCYTCHLPHISDFKPLLKRSEEELCLKCHEQAFPKDAAANRLRHGGVTKGHCSGCHNPHGSNDQKLLRGSRDSLCAACHGEVLKSPDGTPWRFFHGPVGTGNCTACHVLGHQHGAADDSFLKVKGSRVCALCHDTKAEHVKENYRAKMRDVQNDCLTCHLPHGADNKLLMKGEGK